MFTSLKSIFPRREYFIVLYCTSMRYARLKAALQPAGIHAGTDANLIHTHQIEGWLFEALTLDFCVLPQNTGAYLQQRLTQRQSLNLIRMQNT